MQNILLKISDDRLRAYVIFLPAIDGDRKEDAGQRSSEFIDKRVTYLWDANRTTGFLWQRVLGLDSFAWDVYFLYAPNAKWEKEPPMPDFWMHQRRGIFHAPFLFAPEFEAKVKEFLATKGMH